MILRNENQCLPVYTIKYETESLFGYIRIINDVDVEYVNPICTILLTLAYGMNNAIEIWHVPSL